MNVPTYDETVQKVAETLITPLEIHLVEELGKVWNRYLELPNEHCDELGDFRTAIHRAQELILARTGRRQLQLREQSLKGEREAAKVPSDADMKLMQDIYQQLRFAWQDHNERNPGGTNYGLNATLNAVADLIKDPGSPWWRSVAKLTKEGAAS